jgi:hypothetical protein
VPFLLLALYGGCSDGKNGTNQDDCLDASSNSSIIEEHIDCPADAVVQICTGFICDIANPSQNNPFTATSTLLFNPSNCVSSSCLDFTCESTITDSGTGMLIEIPVIGDYTIDTVSGNVVTGTVLLTDEEAQEIAEFDFACSPFVI